MAFALAAPAGADSGADAGTGPSEGRPEPGRRLVLFGARWCAPCMAEYRSLPAIVAAAGTDRVVLAWVDAPMAVPAALAGKVDALSAREAQRLAARVLGEGYGLPSAAVLVGGGEACSVWRAPLRERDVGTLLDRCAPARGQAAGPEPGDLLTILG